MASDKTVTQDYPSPAYTNDHDMDMKAHIQSAINNATATTRKAQEILNAHATHLWRSSSQYIEDYPALGLFLGLFAILAAVPLVAFLSFAVAATIFLFGFALISAFMVWCLVLGGAAICLFIALTIAFFSALTIFFWAVVAFVGYQTSLYGYDRAKQLWGSSGLRQTTASASR